MTETRTGQDIAVAVLTGGSDKPYVFGLITSLMSRPVSLDLIGSDELDCPEFRGHPRIRFLNLRGSQRSEAGVLSKTLRILKYYVKLIRYAATARPKIFHILWNNKFEYFDRTLLLLYYRLLGKRIVLTAHNVNAGKRDSQDTRLNRATLRIQYQIADHIFVHTEKMKRELIQSFGAQESRVTVIPFGINNAVPVTSLTRDEARRRLGLYQREKTILFFGRITPYKGLELLVSAFQQISARCDDYRLMVVGRPDRCPEYWQAVREQVSAHASAARVTLRPEFIPDAETEVYFKAADVLVLPYKDIYQSGVLFLGLSFGVPVLAADVGSLGDDIVEGKTGFLFKPEDPAEVGRTLEHYFASDLYKNLDRRAPEIREYAAARHSWETVTRMVTTVYAALLRMPFLKVS